MNEHMTADSNTFADAADWFIRVRAANANSEVHAAWLRWIEADPAHRAAFAEIQHTWDVVGGMQSPPWPRPEELSSGTGVFSARSKRRTFVITALAASVLVAFAGALTVQLDVMPGWPAFASADSQRIVTRRGEKQSAVLPDGSRIELGGATGVKLNFTAERRLVKADEGEVFYKVKHDVHRPFVVQTGPVSVTAIGTAFSVRREGEAVSVVVTEGAVDVKTSGALQSKSSVRAKAGQRVRFDRGKLSPEAEPVQTEITTTWRRGQLRFEEEPLRVVVASLNRYSTQQIVLADPTLGELRFTGTVFDDSAEDWLKAAERVFPVRIEETAPGRVVIERRDE